jgi:hypothetical protein
MRVADRNAIARRLAAAEAVIAERQLARLMDLLIAEDAASPDVGAAISACLARAVAAAKSGAIESKAHFIRRVLGELAAAVPAVSGRVAAALGVELPAPTAASVSA